MVIQLHLIESKESEKFEIAVQRFIDEIKKEKKSKSRMIQHSCTEIQRVVNWQEDSSLPTHTSPIQGTQRPRCLRRVS